jgi:CheY-like chemotaxis protein
MNILIIEDEALIAKSLKKLIEMRGHSAQIIGSGIEAIKLIKLNTYDRIICDLMLQDISGFDVIEESKERYTNDDISDIFIIMTAYSSGQILQKASTYGCIVLSKPFSDINKAIDIFIEGNQNEES